MGYNEAIITIASTYGLSWTPWAWRPGAATKANANCEDVNEAGNGLELRHPTDGLGADWKTIWA